MEANWWTRECVTVAAIRSPPLSARRLLIDASASRSSSVEVDFANCRLSPATLYVGTYVRGPRKATVCCAAAFLKNGNLWVAEAVARDMPHVPLEDALKLVHLSEKESPKFKKAAMKFLRRYLDEKEPTLKNFAKVVRGFEEREPEVR